MTTDYKRIRRDNREDYGAKGATKYGRVVSEELYAGRVHFIYELLQNAEDALGRRGASWNGERKVSFTLEENRLRVEHHGDPFNEHDVRAICEFDESTKRDSLTEIGRFGIGFKSVYAYSSEPHIHSGDEHFAIRDYIYPYDIPALGESSADRTIFYLPFRTDISSAPEEIHRGLRSLNRRTLLFLQHIDEITWDTEDGPSGHQLRQSERIAGDQEIHQTTLVAGETGSNVQTEEWLTFSQAVDNDSELDGKVQVAYLFDSDAKRVQAVTNCRLFARFPTGLETHMGLLMDGPYRTTLDRSSVPSNASWNKRLIMETADLVVKSLRWLRDQEWLDAEVLRCLPLTEPSTDSLQAFFRPIFDGARNALRSEPLLPRHCGGYIAASEALASRTAGLRELFSSDQLASLYGPGAAWLNGSLDETRDVQDYLGSQLGVQEIRPEYLLSNLTSSFLERQSDEWIVKFCAFLYGQRAPRVRERLAEMTLVRLDDGRHVVPKINGAPQAFFLPNDTENSRHIPADRPIVHPCIREDDNAVRLLREMGISEWDAVDDVINRILPKYEAEVVSHSEDDSRADIAQVLEAYQSSTGNQKNRLVQELRACAFVPAVAATGEAERVWRRADAVYLPTEDLRILFDGVDGVSFADLQVLGDDQDIEQSLRKLLQQCGASPTLRTKKFSNRGRFTENELANMRYRNHPYYSYPRRCTCDKDPIDVRLYDLDRILTKLFDSDPDERENQAHSLWNCLSELPRDNFEGTYKWFYHRDHSSRFTAEFVDTLNDTRWVPLPNGCLGMPSDAVFEELGWPPDRVLQEFLDFRPPSPEGSRREELASEAGINHEYLDVVQRAQEQGVTPDELSRLLHERRGRTASTPASPPDELDAGSFLEALLERQAVGSQNGDQRAPVTLPTGGPNTSASAAVDTSRSVELARQEGWRMKEVSHRERGPEGRALADEFRDMVKGDYGRRCQICGSTFTRPDGEPQVFIVHLVAPSRHIQTNHFGNLLGLCGWHFALVQHGQSQFMTTEHASPVDDPEHLTELILNLPEEIDEAGNPYRALPIRFQNVYGRWASEPSTINAEIRYSLPHWEYLCTLVKDD